MAQYDGSIRIGTGIDTKEFKAGSKEIESEARRMAKTVSKDLGDSAKIALQKQTDAFVKQNQQYAAQEQKIKDLGTTLHELQRTGVETPIFKQTSKDLASAEKKLDGLYGTLRNLEAEGKENSAPYKHAIVQIDIYKKKVSELQNQLKELKYSGEAYTPADTSKIESEIATAEKKQMQMYTALQTSADALTSKISQSVEKESERSNKLAEEVAEEERLAAIRENAVVGNQRIVEVVERRKQLAQEIADMESAGVGLGYKQYDSAKRELAQLDQEIRDYSNSVNDMKKSYRSLSDSIRWAFGAMAKGLKDIPIAAVKAGARGLVSVFQKLGTVVKKVATGPFKLLGNMAKTAFSKLNKSAGRSNGLLGTMASRFKGLALSLLIFNQISKAFNAMISGIKQGFGNLYNEVSGFKSAVDGLKASSLTLKNSFAAAFRPLVEIAIPYIQKAIEYMTMLADSFGQFMAAVTGQKTYTKAVKQTTAALEEAKEAEEGYLSPLDEVNKYQDKGSTAGSGGTSGTMFEESVPIKSTFLDMYQNMKTLIENQDWEGLGVYVAGKLNQGLQKIYDVINWNNIGPQITYFVTAFTGSFNGIVDNLDWDLLGKSIGAGINTIVNSLTLLITGVDWVNLGAELAAGLNGLVNEVDFTNIGNLIGIKFMVLPSILLGIVTNLDWAAIGTQIGNALNGVVSAIDLSVIGEMLGRGLTGIFQMAINFSATFDWEALGVSIYQGINTFLSNVDFATVGQGISDFAMGILDALLVAVQGIDWAELGSSIVDFIVNIDWIGLAVKLLEVGVHLIGGLLEGILVAISDIGRWLRENVFDPIVDWFKKLFDIHSPSTVMAELGTFLMEGLFNGISSLVENVASIFGDLKQKIGEKWSEISDAASQKWGEIKQSLSDKWSQIKTDAGVIFDKVRGNISESWQKVKDNTSTAWRNVNTTLQSAWGVAKNNSSVAANYIKNGVLGAWNLLKSGSSNIWDSVFGKIDDVLSSIKNVIQSVFGWISDMVGGILEKIGSVFSKANEASKVSVPSKGGSSGGKITRSALETYSMPLPKETIAAINNIPIPRLATGAVIPANREFLAVLGDQKHGTNIEAPLDTIKQALREEALSLGLIGRGNESGNLTLKVYLEDSQLINPKKIFEAVITEGKVQQMSTGKNRLLLEN